jgi:hypothetical protein
MPLPVNEFIRCVQYSIEHNDVRSVDLDMPKGLMTVTFQIPQNLVSMFVKACEQAEKVVRDE